MKKTKSEWKNYIRSCKDRKQIFIVCTDENFCKGPNNECIFFESDKEAYEYAISHEGTKIVTMYLSAFLP